MSDESFDLAPPRFNAENALTTLKRQLRDLKLAERGNGFELRGKRVLELAVDGASIQVRIARRLMVTPEWDKQVIASADAQRNLLTELKKRLERWEREE